MGNSASKIKLATYDDLLKNDSATTTMEVDLKELYDFKDHPFKVLDDEKMDELVESISQKGVLVPGIARPRVNGGYELIAGHRRKHASIRAGKFSMPITIIDCSDEEAVVIMVDTNIQRESLLCSEKAFAYKMKYNAIKKQGARTDLMNDERVKKENANVSIGNTTESIRTIQRYISLTNLISKLLNLVDGSQLGFLAGVELSYLKSKEQVLLVQYMTEHKIFPTFEQAEELHKYSKKEEIDSQIFERVLKKNNVAKRVKVFINSERLETYFTDDYSKAEIEDIIFSLLEEWKQHNQNKLLSENGIIPGQESIETWEDGKYLPN